MAAFFVRTSLMVLLLSLFPATGGMAASRKNTPAENKPGTWTVADTVRSAFSYNPSIRQEQESRRIAEENVRQAKSGNLPRVDVYSGGGGRTVLVPKY